VESGLPNAHAGERTSRRRTVFFVPTRFEYARFSANEQTFDARRSQLMQSVRRHTGSFANDLPVEPQWNDQQGVALLPLTVARAARPTSSSPSVAGSGTTCCSVTLS
jgi:hypothetical protein